MPKAASRCATSRPMRPSPTTPAVLSASSTPTYFERFHSPPRSAALAAGMRRATAASSATACSAALTMFDSGALTTITPRVVAVTTSTLSSPIPARATTFSERAAASTSASTLVALRTIRASASGIAPSRAARSVPSRWRTSNSPDSSSSPAGDSSSATRTTGTVRLLGKTAGGTAGQKDSGRDDGRRRGHPRYRARRL